MRPRGSPPTPSATSSDSDPVETAPIATWAWSFIFMTAPLPNWRSICPSTVSSACSRSIPLPTSRGVRSCPELDALEDDVLRPCGPQHRRVDSGIGRTDRAETVDGRSRPGRLSEPRDGDVREPGPLLTAVDAEPLEPLADLLGERRRGAAHVVVDDHPDAPRLAVALGPQGD